MNELKLLEEQMKYREQSLIIIIKDINKRLNELEDATRTLKEQTETLHKNLMI